ncbi:uncharacterized protein LOC133880456 [Alnus glutinosa]|uniref:uncharacterized protein LOC133880456 n=1 Tax=Alnus glutinosa TaxID=3517 RepID=UPI002D76B633|nr:uncharacterized protein LOC133880456 [Alnus glutinosa]
MMMKIVARCGINVHHLAENRLMIEIEDGKITRKPKRQAKNMSVKKKLLKEFGCHEFSCHICRKVNRELMELIESLQGRVIEENVEEPSEETDGSHDKLDEIADNVEICEEH